MMESFIINILKYRLVSEHIYLLYKTYKIFELSVEIIYSIINPLYTLNTDFHKYCVSFVIINLVGFVWNRITKKVV